MRLDPLGTATEQLHLLPLLLLLLLHHLLDLLRLPLLLLPLVPLLLQLLQIMVLFSKRLVAIVQLIVVVLELRIVHVQCGSVRVVSCVECSGQLGFIGCVLLGLLIQLLLELVDLLLQLGFPLDMLFIVLLPDLVAFVLEVVLSGLPVSLLINLLVFQVLELFLALLTLLFGGLLELKEGVLFDSELFAEAGSGVDQLLLQF